VEVVRTGRMYESEPMYVEDQDRFINTVIEVSPFAKFTSSHFISTGRELIIGINGSRTNASSKVA
jgi:7,8-dihydro-6-hydroxymethylpterin-pyrophosphokinase